VGAPRCRGAAGLPPATTPVMTTAIPASTAKPSSCARLRIRTPPPELCERPRTASPRTRPGYIGPVGRCQQVDRSTVAYPTQSVLREPGSARVGLLGLALRALGDSTISRYMGTSLINIDRTYAHLARDSHTTPSSCSTTTQRLPPRGRRWPFRGRRIPVHAPLAAAAKHDNSLLERRRHESRRRS
jgi:hypothetical protein